MKAALCCSVLLLGIGWLTAAEAGDVDSGFFLGGGGAILAMDGTGQWGGLDFSIDAPLTIAEGAPLGLNWDEKLLFGGKPMAGYRINPNLTVQASFNFFIRKASTQSSSVTEANYVYRQRMDAQWNQRGVELLGMFYPLEGGNLFFFGGLDLVSIKTKVIFSEGLDYQEWDGVWGIAGDSQSVTDRISAGGFLFGGGLETPPSDSNLSTLISLQYSTAATDDVFFGTDGFRVKVGGFSALLGFKWYLPRN